MKKLYPLALSLLLINLVSCDWIDSEEPIPGYIRIEEFDLNTNTYSQGPDNHKITDAWIYVNGDFIGLFEMPCEVPVLNTGDVTIHVKPGIKNNGIAASRIHYPFYKIFEIDETITELETLTLHPVTSYYDEATFAWFENFEDPGISLDTTILSNTALYNVSGNGSRVGYIKLEDSTDVFEAETIQFYEFPTSNFTTFIEMDYKCNQEFTVGLYIRIPGSVIIQPLIYMNPMEDWNKIYIDASYYAQTTTDAIEFRIYFQATKDLTLEKGEIYLDNLKLVHF